MGEFRKTARAVVMPVRNIAGTQKKKILLAVTALLLIMAGAGAWAWISRRPEPAQNATPQLTGTALESGISRSNAKKDYAGTVKLLEAQENIAEPEMQLELAVAYENAKEYVKALAVYAELDQKGLLKADYTFRAGEVAKARKDTATAIKYYELAKERYRKEDVRRLESKLRRCDDRLAEMRGKAE